MTGKVSENPFSPGGGHVPLKMAGREEETRTLNRMLDRLQGERVEGKKRLRLRPSDPIKIVGPRGVGKTALLNWTKQQAEDRGIRFVSCEGLKLKEDNLSMGQLLVDIAGNLKNALSRIKGFGASVVDKVGVSMELRQVETYYKGVTEAAVRSKPLLLLMDEVHHYDLPLLKAVLQGSQKLIGEGYPLGLVLAGTPELDSHLREALATFIVRCKKIYINTLSDEATREALRVPFKQGGIKVTPRALKAMAEQTDNYPFFIHLVGEAVWYAMEEAGRRDVDVKLVKQIEEQARNGREEIYDEAFIRMRGRDLVPLARRVMELLESRGGLVSEDAVIKVIKEDDPSVDGKKAEKILVALREDGFIWTVRGRTMPGIPSLFSYFKTRQEEQ